MNMKKSTLTKIGILCFLVLPRLSFSQCSLFCNAGAQVALDMNCLAQITADDVLEGNNNCLGPFSVDVFDAFGNLIPSSPFVDGSYLDQTLIARVTDQISGNFCETPVSILDNIPPAITCNNLNLGCNNAVHPDAIGYAQVVDNCDNDPDLNFSDLIEDPSCSITGTKIITRTWTATDASGNSATACIQTITLQRPSLANIQFPEDVSATNGNALDCVNADISPDNTGYPTLNGLPLIDGIACELWIDQEDSAPLPICQGAYRILRTWTVNDECTNDQVTDIQTIEVLDTEGPDIDCPQDFTVSVGTNSCSGTVLLPEASATDNCSLPSGITINIEDEAGNSINANSPILLPVGIHQFTYEAVDACGNTSTCILQVTVDDGVNPVVICESFTTVALGQSEPTLVDASTFNNGSYDNCGPISFLARRMDNPECPGDDASPFETTVPFYCCDVGDTVIVEMRIEDAINRLSNSCMVSVLIQDKLNPQITCPPDITLSCEQYDLSPDITGEPDATDNCEVSSLEFSDSTDLNICHTGTILRTWTVSDGEGQQALCLQRITLVDTTEAVVSFPPSVENAECGDSDDPENTGVPVVEDNCGQFAINYDDSVVEFDDDCLRKIIRIWTVYDWCKDTTYIDVQIIKEFDTQPPVFDMIPQDMTVECDAVPVLPIVSATDICDNGNEVIFSESTDVGDCADEFTIIRKWVSMDQCGNTDSIEQLITVVDTSPPIISGESPDTLLSCEEMIPMANLSAVDNCDPDVDFVMEETIIPGICDETFMIIRTWTAVDNCGNEAIRTQNISVQDNEAPVFNAMPANLTVECDMIPEPADLTATDNCDVDVSILFEEMNQSGICENSFTIIRSWRAVDNCGNEVSAIQEILVEDNTPPVLTGVPVDMTVDCGMIPEAPLVTVEDNCAENIVVDFMEEVMMGACSEDITVTRTWTAEDNCGNMVSAQQVISSMDTEAPVLMGVPMDMTVDCGMIPEAPQVTAEDNCAENIVVDFMEEVMMGACPEDITVTRTWTAEDNCGNMVSAQQVISSMDTEAPVLMGVPMDMTVECGMIPEAPQVTAEDNCAENIVVDFMEEVMMGACSEDITVTRTWTATDNCGNMVTVQQVISSTDTEAPVLMGVPMDITVECGMIPEAPQVTAEDNCAENIVVDFMEEVMMGACSEDITVTRTWTATDNCGNMVSAQQVISSTDTEAPVLMGVPMDMTVDCGMIPEAPQVTAEDNCAENIVVDFMEEVMTGVCSEDITVTRTWAATDNCGNMVSAQQVISSTDTEAPVLMGVPMDMTVQCDAVPQPPQVTAMDNCDDDVMIVFEETIPEQNCTDEFVLLWTWTARDNCGNENTLSTTIEVIDDNAPVLSGVPANVTVECTDLPEIPSPTATDNCDPDPEIQFSEQFTDPDCGGGYKLFRTWTAIDNCENQSIRTQIITLIDSTPPVFTNAPDDITVECDSVPDPLVLTAMDECGNGAVVQFVEDIIINGGCTSNFIINRTWEAVDSCGNTNTFTQMITVEDNTPPVIECPDNITFDIQSVGVCDFTYGISPAISDNCDLMLPSNYQIDFGTDGVIDSTGSILGSLSLQISFPIGENTVELRVEDDCGNTASCSLTVTVNDLVPPAFFCNPQTISLNSTDSSAFVLPEAFLLDPFMECCLDTLLIEDIDNPGQRLDTLFLDYDDFLESQMLGGIPVEIFAIDCYGNESSCNTKVFVLPPMSPPGFGFISGQVFTEDYEPLENIEINLDGGMPDLSMTDTEGQYAFSELPEGFHYQVAPYYNQDHLNGISTWDLILLQRHILEIQTLNSPYKMIAADVNRSGHISMLDIVELRKLILGNITVFSNNTSWRFIEANFLFPNETNPFASVFPEFCAIENLESEMDDMDFIGIKTGDLNNSAEMGFIGESESRNSEQAYFITKNKNLEEGEEISISFRVKDFTSVLGFQFGLEFDVQSLEFLGINTSVLPGFNTHNLGLNFLEEGLLNCSWHHGTPVFVKDEEDILTLTFRTKAAGSISNFLNINTQYTKAELYRVQEGIIPLGLQFEALSENQLPFELFQNHPNPFQTNTEIGFALHKNSEVMLSIYNVSGKLIRRTKGYYSAGMHQLNVDASELEGRGIYFYQLKTKDRQAYRKMVLTN